jgi:hypothetical protein
MTTRSTAAGCVLATALLLSSGTRASDSVARVAGPDANAARQVVVTVVNPPPLPASRAGTTPQRL